MAVTSREVRAETGRHSGGLVQRLLSGFNLLVLLLAFAALYVLANAALVQLQIWRDDLHYGRPRTTHLTVYNAQGERHAQIIAANFDRQVVLLEVSASDPGQVRSLPAPYLVGADEGLTPIVLELRDLDADGQADLLVNIKREQLVYLARDGSFRLPTAEEQHTLGASQRP